MKEQQLKTTENTSLTVQNPTKTIRLKLSKDGLINAIGQNDSVIKNALEKIHHENNTLLSISKKNYEVQKSVLRTFDDMRDSLEHYLDTSENRHVIQNQKISCLIDQQKILLESLHSMKETIESLNKPNFIVRFFRYLKNKFSSNNKDEEITIIPMFQTK